VRLPVLRFHGKRAPRLARVVRATVTVPPVKRLVPKARADAHKLLAHALAHGREGSRAHSAAFFSGPCIGSLSIVCAAVAVLKKTGLGIQIEFMSTKPTRPNPQAVFESALAVLNQKDSSTESSKLAKSLPLRASFDRVRVKERALNEAAHALAELWKR